MEVLEATQDWDGEEQQEPSAPAQGEIFVFSTLFLIAQDEDCGDPIHAYAASADPDTLYHHEAMRELDLRCLLPPVITDTVTVITITAFSSGNR